MAVDWRGLKSPVDTKRDCAYHYGETKAKTGWLDERATWFHKGFDSPSANYPGWEDKLNSIDFDKQVEASHRSSAEPAINEIAGEQSLNKGGPRTKRGKAAKQKQRVEIRDLFDLVLLEDEPVSEFRRLQTEL